MTRLAKALQIAPRIRATAMQWHDVVGLEISHCTTLRTLQVHLLVVLGNARPRATTRAHGVQH